VAEAPHLAEERRPRIRGANGALAHREGRVFVGTADRRDTGTWLQFLDHLAAFVPDGEVYLIVDPLPLHWTVDTMLWNLGHPRFHFVPLPKAAACLSLIEGFRKILTQRTLRGRTCRSTEEVAAALQAGAAHWNARPTPLLCGRPPIALDRTKTPSRPARPVPFLGAPAANVPHRRNLRWPSGP
jgi:hypothetical protein